MVCDNGPEFVSSDLQQWCESLGTKEMESPVYHITANGLAERAGQTMSGHFKNGVPISMSHLELAAMGTNDTSQQFEEAEQKHKLKSCWDAELDYQQLQIWTCANPFYSRPMKRQRHIPLPSPSGRA